MTIKYFSQQDVTLVEKKTVFQGFFRMEQYQIKHALFKGGQSTTFQREIFERGQAACVLLWDPAPDQLVMIEQFRLGALNHPVSPWLIELVAGMIEAGETPDNVVKREAAEEAGVNVHQLHSIGSYLSSPGGTSERVWLFIGRVDAAKAGGIHGLDNENEDIRVQVLPRKLLMAELFNHVGEGQQQKPSCSRVDNAATIICLQWLALHHQQLRAQWEEH